MQVEMFTQDAGLRGGPEIWVKVLSNEVVDWPSVKAKFNREQADALKALGARLTQTYYPHLVTPTERDEHGYRFEEWWVWAKAQ